MVDMMAEVVAGVRKALPKVPIGIEPNAIPRRDLERLKTSGADELKVNVQAASKRVFDIVCPRLEREDILRCLRDGVEVFGRGRVASNVIIGLGETDDEVLDCIKELAEMGVVANLRALRVNDANARNLEGALGSAVGVRDPTRIERLVRAQKTIFEKAGLSPRGFRTMCHRCACCDLTVGVDL